MHVIGFAAAAARVLDLRPFCRVIAREGREIGKALYAVSVYICV